MIKRERYLAKIIRSMWNGEIKVITGILLCNLIDFLLEKVELF